MVEEAKFLYIETYGCQMNDYDSSRIRAALNLEVVDDPRDADVVIINTCSIRDKADHKAFSSVGRLKRLKRNNPLVILGVGGCAAQLYGEKLLERNPHLDLVFGTRNIPMLPKLISELRRERRVETSFDVEDIFEVEPYHEQGRVTGYVSVQQGCNKKCTYCIVPSVRGEEVNRPTDKIIREASNLVNKGARELTLIGQTVNSWKYNGERFSDLLRRAAEIEGLLRLRFTTSYPRDLTKKLIETIRNTKEVCHHIHLPVQSGSDRILSAMARTYTTVWYLEAVDRLRDAVPDMALSTDIIVGFPGETAEDFDDTMKLIEQVQFDGIFSFKYSARHGTPAAELRNAVPDEAASTRLRELQELQREITLKKNQARVGVVEEVLVEGESKNSPELVSGRTSQNRIVNFNGKLELKGEIAKVKIVKAFQNSLRGQLN
ncbi:MAG: tRNA (N6-isopentenyl adenosine(37)-C2)-methylthiotransferase MiaB [Thermodesulfobacteriota bacterium]